MLSATTSAASHRRCTASEAPTSRSPRAGCARPCGRSRTSSSSSTSGAATRRASAFGDDTPWQRELEDSFPFVETPDQLKAINDVKEDMEAIHPMDRLLCA